MSNTYDTDIIGDNNENDLEKDVIRAKYLQMEKNVCFLDNAVFVVEVLVSEHNRSEVKKAKVKEIKNHQDYVTFELVEDFGQECIVINWVFTQKKKRDGQNTDFKARLVAR